jgi:hypothetical protein
MEELLEIVFSELSVPSLYNEDQLTLPVSVFQGTHQLAIYE